MSEISQASKNLVGTEVTYNPPWTTQGTSANAVVEGWHDNMRPVPYADPAFTPGMVVCAADRDRNDMRTWEAFQPEVAAPGEWLFDALWWTVGARWDARDDLPARLAVVGADGRAA